MLAPQRQSAQQAEAWVGFRDNAGLAWLKLLKPGYRHCFVLLPTPGGWIVCDPLAHHTRIEFVAGGFEILDELSAQGCRLLPAAVRVPARRALAWRPYSCVEAVKRTLGLMAPWVLTPWQLHGLLQGQKKNCPTQEKSLDVGKKAV